MLGYEPTPGKIASIQKVREGLGGYGLRVVYQYQRDRRSFEGRRFMPLTGSGSLIWAERHAERYPPGESVTVYVDPQEPGRSFLAAEARFYPYLLMLCPVAAGVLLLAGLARGGCFEPPPRAQSSGPFDWYHIPAGSLTSSKMAFAAVGAAGWYACGLAVAGHYLTVASCVVDQALAWSVFGVYALGGWPLIAAWMRQRRLSLLVADASLGATLPSFRTDGLVNVRLSQRVLRDVAIDEATLSLVCAQRRGLFHRERMFVDSRELASDAVLRGGQQLVAEGRFEIPPRKRRPSSRGGRWHYPRTEWFVEVSIRLAEGGRYRVTYPIRVDADRAATDGQSPDRQAA
jgi:hypothetical protein